VLLDSPYGHPVGDVVYSVVVSYPTSAVYASTEAESKEPSTYGVRGVRSPRPPWCMPTLRRMSETRRINPWMSLASTPSAILPQMDSPTLARRAVVGGELRRMRGGREKATTISHQKVATESFATRRLESPLLRSFLSLAKLGDRLIAQERRRRSAT